MGDTKKSPQKTKLEPSVTGGRKNSKNTAPASLSDRDLKLQELSFLAQGAPMTSRSSVHYAEDVTRDRNRGTNRREREQIAERLSTWKAPGSKKTVPMRSFIVVPLDATDHGSRPLSTDTPFATSNVGVGPDGRPFVIGKNLGNMPLYGVIAEFFYFDSGQRVEDNSRQSLGFSAPMIMQPGQVVRIECPNTFTPTLGQTVFSSVFDPILDPHTNRSNPISDRHAGQNTFPFCGTYEGLEWVASRSFKSRVQITPEAGGMFRIRVFSQVSGGLPTNPQVEILQQPQGKGFVFHKSYPFKEEEWQIWMRDNNTIAYRLAKHFTDASGRADQVINAALSRV